MTQSIQRSRAERTTKSIELNGGKPQSETGSFLSLAGGPTHSHGQIINAREEDLIRQASKNTEPVFAIDPGTTKSAYVRLSPDRDILAFGCVPNADLRTLLLHAREKLVAIEMVASYGMAVGEEVFETVRWIGRFEEVARNFGQVQMVYRKDVKMHLCHSMRAKDPNIRQALLDKYGQQGTKKNPGPTYGLSGDMWSALAVGDYALGRFHVTANA